MNEGPIELSACDRDVRRVVERLAHLRASLGTAEGREAARHKDPFGSLRWVAGLSTYRALSALRPSVLDVPHRDGLARFVYELLQARIELDLTLDDADAIVARDPRLPRDAAPATAAELLLQPERAQNYLQAWSSVLRVDEGRVASALGRVAELAEPVAAVRKERRARRVEVARRVGLAHPAGLSTATPIGDLLTTARSLLDRTEGLSEELLKTHARQQEAPWSAGSTMRLALARDAAHGWPAHLGRRWLEDVFHALLGRPLPPGELAELPEPLGGASFLRAGCALGHALRIHGTARNLPFALARDPYPTSAHRFGFALATVMASAPFQRRALDVGGRTGEAQARALTRALFLSTRFELARFLLGEGGETPSVDFDEITTRVFGRPLPPALRHAWPAPRVDAAARMMALLGTPRFVADLTDRFDDDWFRNPRAGAHLTSPACAPAFDDEPLPKGAVEVIGRTFEARLG